MRQDDELIPQTISIVMSVERSCDISPDRQPSSAQFIKALVDQVPGYEHGSSALSCPTLPCEGGEETATVDKTSRHGCQKKGSAKKIKIE